MVEWRNRRCEVDCFACQSGSHTHRPDYVVHNLLRGICSEIAIQLSRGDDRKERGAY